MNQEEKQPEEVDIELIMQDIRHQILSQKQFGRGDLPVAGRRFSSAFYERLYRADLLLGEPGLTLDVSKSTVPIIGTLIDKLRRKFHELVIFYVNQAAIPQHEFNENLLQAVTMLSQELEEEIKPTDDTP